jgi:hypothetical protein
MAIPTSESVHPGRADAHTANTGRITNMPKRRSPKMAARDTAARNSPGVIRGVEFTSKTGLEREKEAGLY